VRRPAALLLFVFCLPAAASTQTLFGFFPSPPVMTTESVLATFKAIGEHGDMVLFQRNVPWIDFVAAAGGETKDIRELTTMVQLAQQNNLEPVLVVDPLNGLDRRRFAGLPPGWKPSFANPDVRAAMTNYALRIVTEFHPRFLGLASEINTYQDTHPDDYPGFVTLYREIYARVKAAAPSTQVFVTFQWDELNNLTPGLDGGKPPYETRWEQVEAYEPQLDLWAISTYPFFFYRSAGGIPADYYSRLASRTTRPLAVAECGYTTENMQAIRGTPQDQAMFLKAVHDQLGARLRLWVYTVLGDFSLDSYAPFMKQQGVGGDIPTLGWFAHIGLRGPGGTPKPGLALWDSFR
jgi:hypothetical protein